MERKIKTIVITHKDRFIRFGYDWFESFCEKYDTSILVVNNEELSPQEELVEDIVSILHVFSCRLYGLRKYKKLLTLPTAEAGGFSGQRLQPAPCEVLHSLTERIGSGVSHPTICTAHAVRRKPSFRIF